MIEGWYNIHDIVKIHLHGQFKSAQVLDTLLARFKSEPIDSSQIDLEFFDLMRQHDNFNVIHTEPFCYQPKDQTIWDSKSTVRSHPSGKISVYSNWGIDHYVLLLLMQLQLVRKGFLSSHAAGFATKGNGVIFPSWPGTGKTGLVTFMVNQERVNILGDQILFISKDGTVYSCPWPITVLHYHIDEQLPVVTRAFEKKSNIFSGKTLGPLYNKLRNSASSALTNLSPRLIMVARKYVPSGSVEIPLEQLVPSHRISSKVPLKKVVSMLRWSGKSFQVEQCDSNGIIPEMINAWSSELFLSSPQVRQFLIYWLGLSSFGALESWQWFLSSQEQILKEALKDVECYRLKIPEEAQVTEVGKFVMGIIES